MAVIKYLDFTFYCSHLNISFDPIDSVIRFHFDNPYPDLVFRSDSFSLNFCSRLADRLHELYEQQMEFGLAGNEIILENIFEELF